MQDTRLQMLAQQTATGSNAGSGQLRPGVFRVPTQPLWGQWGQSDLASQNPFMPSTSSQARNSHEDLVSPFLSCAEDREFSDSESDSDEETSLDTPPPPKKTSNCLKRQHLSWLMQQPTH